jgi:hypothetical protein
MLSIVRVSFGEALSTSNARKSYTQKVNHGAKMAGILAEAAAEWRFSTDADDSQCSDFLSWVQQ